MKLHRVIVMLRDENVDLRAKNIDIQTDYVILDESYKNFITVREQQLKIKRIIQWPPISKYIHSNSRIKSYCSTNLFAFGL